jgi:hypothetical protein
MRSKYTVQVRIKVNGSKKSVKGISSYSSESYDKKYKKAVLNAVYVAYSENKAGKGRKKKLKYDDKFDYELSEKPRIAYLGKPVKYAKKGVNKRLHNEILKQQEIKFQQSERQKEKEKFLDKSISKKKHQEELYGKEEKMNNKILVDKKEYEKFKAYEEEQKLKKKKK